MMGLVAERSGTLRRWAAMAGAWSPEERDAVLYAASALFAILTAQLSGIALYRQWGDIAVGPYVFGAVASAWAERRARRRADVATPVDGEGPGGRPPWHWTGTRATIFLVVLVGATLLPLSLEVLWRSDGGPATAHVQPEVPVVERAGLFVAHGRNPYQKIDPSRPPPVPAGEPAYDAFNPYLPLMAVFGLPRSTDAPPRLTDARVAFSIITILLVVVALAMTRGPTGPRVVTLQTMTVLPTAALPLATGGDDVPVAALLLVALVLLQRRRPLWAGLVLGTAASMKFTAWPLAALAILVVRDRAGRRTRRARLTLAGGVAAVMVPAVLPSAAANFSAFVQNVVRFPLGLAGMNSPAGTPLLGHVVVTLFPQLHRVFPLAVAVVGAAVLGWVLVRRTPTSPASLSSLLGWAMTAAILLAPSTRIGYVLYPVGFFVWSWLLRAEERFDALLGLVPAGDDAEGDMSATARARRRTVAA